MIINFKQPSNVQSTALIKIQHWWPQFKLKYGECYACRSSWLSWDWICCNETVISIRMHKHISLVQYSICRLFLRIKKQMPICIVVRFVCFGIADMKFMEWERNRKINEVKTLKKNSNNHNGNIIHRFTYVIQI